MVKMFFSQIQQAPDGRKTTTKAWKITQHEKS